MHRSRICYVTIDVNDLDRGAEFWARAVGGELDPMDNEESAKIYRRIRLPDAEIRLLLQIVPEDKRSKSRVHVDIETDEVEAEVARLEELGATRKSRVQERGRDFWVMTDPFGNEFCVVQPEFPDLLAVAPSWD